MFLECQKDQKLNQNWLWVLAADFMSVNPTLNLFLGLKEQKLKPKVIVSFCSQFYKCKSYFRLVFRVSHCTKDEIKANYEYLARVLQPILPV